jgi:hypothetical protein
MKSAGFLSETCCETKVYWISSWIAFQVFRSSLLLVVLCCVTSLFCNVLVKFGEGAVEAEQGAIHELPWKMSHATQQLVAKLDMP